MSRIEVNRAEHSGLWHVCVATEYVDLSIIKIDNAPRGIHINGHIAPESMFVWLSVEQLRQLRDALVEADL